MMEWIFFGLFYFVVCFFPYNNESLLHAKTATEGGTSSACSKANQSQVCFLVF